MSVSQCHDIYEIRDYEPARPEEVPEDQCHDPYDAPERRPAAPSGGSVTRQQPGARS